MSKTVNQLEVKDFILIKGARVHNLKNIDISIPRDQLVVITGLSGSGKSSLAFDSSTAFDSSLAFDLSPGKGTVLIQINPSASYQKLP